MPALIAHCYVASTVFEKIEDESVHKVIQKHMQLFLLAAQGPDIYYYYGLMKRNNNVSKTGKIIHKEKPAMAIDLLRKEVLLAKNNDDRDCAIAILAGFLCHYALDRQAHPYVYYLQKMLENKGKKGGMHSRVEAHLDAWILYNKLGALKPDFQNSIFFITSRERDVYSAIFARLARNISLKVVTASQISKALNSMQRVLRFFYSQSFTLNILALGCRKMAFKWARREDFFIPRLPNGCVDYINVGKNEWFNTVDPNVVSNSSFTEILDEACKDAVGLINELCNSCNRKTSTQSITKNISFITGLQIK